MRSSDTVLASGSPSPSAPHSGGRPYRVLWATAHCLLDTTSGASISARQMLHQLAGQGVEVTVLGATIFDAPAGAGRLEAQWQRQRANGKTRLGVQDGPIKHHLELTEDTARGRMTADEEARWFGRYRQLLDSFQPDLVGYYGGQVLDLLIADEARLRGIPSAAYLVNGNYRGTRWCRDVSLILTDSQATAGHYRQRLPVPIQAVGTFIEPRKVVAEAPTRERLLFINPAPAKGAVIVALLACLLEQRGSAIPIEVVASRGQWQPIVERVTEALGHKRSTLPNVTVTPHVRDMRPIYQRARVLIAPSLWWESGARVLAEAMLNGIPAVITPRGGSPEMVEEAGIPVTLPEACYETPFLHLPEPEVLDPLITRLERLWHDEAHYQRWVERAYQVARRQHDMERNTQRLLEALAPLLARRAGDHPVAAEAP